MSAALEAALRAGVILRADGDRLVLRAPAPLAPSIRSALAAGKADILRVLGPGRSIGPASAAQRAIWLADAAGQGYAVTAATHVPANETGFTPAALSAALGRLVARHPGLRTRLLLVGEEAAQLVEPEASLPLETKVATDLGDAQDLAARFAALPLDPTRLPSGRALLVDAGAAGQVFVLALHHAFCDSDSLDVLSADLAALLRDEPAAAPIGADLLEHAAAERVAGPSADDLAWWRFRLQGVPALSLHAEPLRRQTGAGRTLARIAAPVWQAAANAGRALGATPFATLAGLLGIVLNRRAEAGPLLLHAPATVRRPGFERTVGCFASLLPLVLDLRGDPDLPSAVRSAADAVASMLARTSPPLAAIAEQSPAAARPRLLLTYRRSAPAPGEPIALPSATPKAMLVLEGADGPDGLVLSVEWDRAQVDDGIAAALLAELAELAAAFAAGAPGALPPSHLRLHDALAPAWPRSADETIHDVFARAAAAGPDQIAVRDAEGEFTYRALDDWSDTIAATLRAAPGEVIGTALPRGTPAIAAWLGCLKAGAAYLALDPTWPQARCETVLRAAGATRVLDPAALPPRSQRVHFRQPDVHPLALACVFATSGSTGAPKPVAVPHRAIPRLAADTALARIGAGDVVAHAGSVAFDAASWEVWGALLNGATVAVLPAGTLLDAHALATALRDDGVTHAFLTKTLFDAAIAVSPDAFAGLHTLLVGGEPLDPASCAALARPVRFLNAYGPTEAATFAAWRPIDPDVAGLRRVPIGLPVSGTVLRVLDRRMRRAAIGAIGELHIGGDALARGYLGQPGLTAARFLPDPFGRPGDRLYRTGDLARLLPDGSIDLLGRMDQQVKIRGFRIEPAEVQSALRGLPGVTAAHVAARSGADGSPVLQAWVAGMDGAAARAALRAVLPEPMIPAQIWQVPRLPVTSSGKVDQAALPQDGGVAATGDRPQGHTEQTIAALAEAVLGVPLGRETDIFAAGAHSLAAMRLLARLRLQFGDALSLRDLFEAPTIAKLAALIAARGLARQPRPGDALGRNAAPLVLPAQERIWLLTRLGGASAWHIPIAVRLRGPLDPAALCRAADALVARHVALRTGVIERDGRPVAAAHGPGPAPFAIHPAPDDLATALAAEAARPFDLARGPFLRIAVWTIAAEEHVALLVLHHIAADGWSVGILLRELAALYTGETLPAVEHTVFDWAQALREHDTGADVAYWRETLAGARAPDLRAAGRGGPGMVRRRLRPGLAEAARSAGTTPFIFGLAAWAAVLARRAGTPDVLLGTVLAGRDHPSSEAIVGMLAQTLPLRLDLQGEPMGHDLLARAAAALEAAHAHRAAPFDAIVRDAGQAGVGAGALLPHLIVLQNQPWPSAGLPGLAAEEIVLPPPAAKAETTLALTADLAEAGLEYSPDGMGEAEASSLLAAFGRVLAALAEARTTRLSALPVAVGRSELRGPHPGDGRVLPCWGPPDAVALVCGAERLTGRDLRQRVAEAADRLAAHGVGPDDLIGLCAVRSVPQVVALLAILQSGGAWLPLEPALPAARLRSILQDARPMFVLADPTGAAALAAAGDETTTLPIDGGERLPARRRRPPPLPSAMAYAVFTSGSTGAPKGVMVSRDALARHMGWMARALPLGPDDRLLLKTPMGFDASVWEYLAAFAGGATLHVAPEGAHRDPPALLAAVAEARATVLQLVPSVLAALLREPGFEASCQSLRRLCLGGEAVPRPLAEAVRKRLPRCGLVNLYGPAEATIQTIVQDGVPDTAFATLPIGRPIEGVRAWLTDAWGAPVEPGTPGRLWLAGPALARGYLRRPALTAERFRPDPDGPPGSRALDTGDIARLRCEDGRFEWLGRADRQIKHRGVRLEPAEIEVALLRLPGVADAVAGMAEGPNGPMLAAWVVQAAPDGESDPERLRAALSQVLPAAMLPSRVLIVPDLPRLPSGKVDRRALELGVDAVGAPASDPLTQTVACAMAALLERAEVPADGNFFALGGHSLLAAQLVAHLREATGRDLPLAALFAAPTPAGIARALGDAPASMAMPSLPAGVPLPLGSAQRRLWAAVQLSGADARWTMGGPMILRGPLDPDALESALATIEARHEPLRTRIVEDTAGVPMQHIDPPGFVLERGEATSLERALDEARRVMARPFDLGHERPFRARLIAVGPQECVVCLSIHHIAADGWSLGVLTRELAALLADPATSLPPVARYANVAAWMDAQPVGPALAWWGTRLAGLPMLVLPGERPHAAAPDDARAAAIPVQLDGAALRLARACAATPFMALAAGFAAALFEATRQPDLALATDVADRRHASAEQVIGFFANPVVLRLQLTGAMTVRELVTRTRTEALGAYLHQHAPADRVLAGLPPIRAKLTWQPAPPAPHIGGCAIEWPQAWPQAIPNELLVNLLRAGDGAVGAALYRSASLREDAVRALLARFAALLGAMAADPDARLSALLDRPAPPVAEAARMRRRVHS